MSQSLTVSDEVYSRVRQLARFSGCDDSAVVQRLLDQLEGDGGVLPRRGASLPGRTGAPSERYLPGRTPRERGATVRLGAEMHQVDSVRDLLETVLRFIGKNGKRDALKALLPFKTSSQRFLIAEQPIHPNGKPFFVPVYASGLYMEAHKSYKTAISDLEDLFEQLKIPFKYVAE